MSKKSAHRKKDSASINKTKDNHTSEKGRTIHYYLKRYFISIFFVALLSLSIPHFATQTTSFCANSISCIKDLSVQVDNNAIGTFEKHRVMSPKVDLAQANIPVAVLGTQISTGTKHIYVDLSSQTLYAFQGTTLFMQTLISSGKWHPTPVGNFTIWIKLQSTRMIGGEGDDAYDLPNVPYTMFFSNAEVPASEGFSIHGAYWHNNFGHPMSHGCVNMRPDDAKMLYDWADPATTGYTTHITQKNPGTQVSICTSIQKKLGKFTCVQ